MVNRMVSGVVTREEPARLNATYQVHYMFFETKKIFRVSQDSMWLEKVWLCVLAWHGLHIGVGVHLIFLERIALRHGIRDVRWNKAVPITQSAQVRGAMHLDI